MIQFNVPRQGMDRTPIRANGPPRAKQFANVQSACECILRLACDAHDYLGEQFRAARTSTESDGGAGVLNFEERNGRPRANDSERRTLPIRRD
jgi:hypothetical protein